MESNGFTLVTAKHNKHRRNNKKHFIKPEIKTIIKLNDVEVEDVIEGIKRIRCLIFSLIYF